MAKAKVAKAKKKLGGPRVGGDGPRQAKVDAVEQMRSKLASSAAVVLTEYRGMTVPELAELRAGLREADAEYRVYKNTLATIAVREVGLEDLTQYFEGPTAFTFANGDPVVAAKKLTDFAKKVPALVVKAGVLEGRVLSAADVNALGSLESREVMLSKAAGMLIMKIQQAANLFAAGFNQLGAVLVQLRDKLPAEGAPAAEAEAPAAEAPAAEAPAAEAPASDEPPAEASPAEEAPAEEAPAEEAPAEEAPAEAAADEAPAAETPEQTQNTETTEG